MHNGSYIAARSHNTLPVAELAFDDRHVGHLGSVLRYFYPMVRNNITPSAVSQLQSPSS